MPAPTMSPLLNPEIAVFPSSNEASEALATRIAETIRERAAKGRLFVLGLATGSTPFPLYQELIRLHREDGLSFHNVRTFNLDEYYGLSPANPQSYHHFMRRSLFEAVDMPAEQWNIPRGDIPRSMIIDHCAAYETAIEEAGGIDLQILGIGRSGHIGFNEPPSSADCLTRLVTLDPVTRQDAVGSFGRLENVPHEAITMGVGTILKAREIALLAWGKGKAEIVARTFTTSPSSELPASFLRTHSRLSVYLDRHASTDLPTSIPCRTL